MTQIMILKRDTIETLPLFPTLLEMGVCGREGFGARYNRPALGHKSLYN